MNKDNKALETVFKVISERKDPVIIITNDTTAVSGISIEILMLLSILVHNLTKNGLKKEEILAAVKVGLLEN